MRASFSIVASDSARVRPAADRSGSAPGGGFVPASARSAWRTTKTADWARATHGVNRTARSRPVRTAAAGSDLVFCTFVLFFGRSRYVLRGRCDATATEYS